MERKHCVALLSSILISFLNLTAQKSSAHEASKHAVTSPDGTFHFEYAATLVRCERNPNQPDRWWPDEACEALTPVCSDFSGQSAETLACVAYPAEEMKGTTFQAAAFSVSELKAATTQAECMKVDEPPPHVGSARRETVNRVTFAVIETDGVATGNLIDGYVYRIFQRDRCYELDIRIAFSNIANAHRRTLKNLDLKAVHHRLKQALDSFKFVNR